MADQPLSESQVIDGFHSFLGNALAQAKVEKLLDPETLSSAQADLMICGPAICLFFAALRSTTDPASVPIPRPNKSSPPLLLSVATCPPNFQALFRLWAQTVPDIQALRSEHQHDLARIICDREPISNPPIEINRIAQDLRAVAIEISQRRTFQDRYADDLQVALDAGTTPSGSEEKRLRASFKPPPLYDPSPVSSAGSSPQGTLVDLPSPSMMPRNLPPQSPDYLSAFPVPITPPRLPPEPRASGSSSRPHSPSILPPESPAILTIRETLYASLAEVLATTPTLQRALKTDPPRAYFAAVGLAILMVSLNSITPEGYVRGVLGNEITLVQCPPQYQPLMLELAALGKRANEIFEEDDQRAIKCVQQGTRVPEPRIDRVRRILEHGVQADDEEYERRVIAIEQSVPPPPARLTKPAKLRRTGESTGRNAEEARRSTEQARRSIEQARRSSEQARQSSEQARRSAEVTQVDHQQPAEPRRSEEGTTLQFTNRINALALRMTRLPAFRERQDEVFKVLAGVY